MLLLPNLLNMIAQWPLLQEEGVRGIPGITGLSFFETFTIMYAPPLIMVAAIVFLFIYMAVCKNPQD